MENQQGSDAFILPPSLNVPFSLTQGDLPSVQALGQVKKCVAQED